MPVQDLEREQAQVIVQDTRVGHETNLLLRILFIIAVLLGLKDDPVIWEADSEHTPSTDRSLVTTRHPIRDKGSLTSVKVEIISGVPDRNVYTSITLEDENQNEVAGLASKYSDPSSTAKGAGSIPVIPGMRIRLESRSSLTSVIKVRGTINKGRPKVGGWTGSDQGLTEGRGAIRSIVGTDPAVQVEIVETVPVRARWLLRSLIFALITDANVANRQVQLIIDDGTNIFYEWRMHDNQEASETRAYNVARDGTAFHATEDNQNRLHQRLPDLYMSAGFRFRTSTTLLQAGDNFGPGIHEVEEWIVAA